MTASVTEATVQLEGTQADEITMLCLGYPGLTATVTTWLRLALDVCMVTCIITCNTFILYAVIRYWKRSMMPPSYQNSTILITSLCVSDVSVGIFFVYQLLPRYFCSVAEYSAHHFVACILHSVLVSIGHFASSLTLVAIAVDRYIAVIHGLRYAEIMTARRTLMMVGAAWGVAVLATTSQFYWNKWTEGEFCETVNFQHKYYEVIVLPGIISFTLISLIVIYWRIHRAAITVLNRKSPHELSPKERLHTRSAKTLLLILIVYIISWPPYLITIIVRQSGYPVSITLVEIFSSETKVTYLANPFIYALNTRPVKESVRKVVLSIKDMFTSKGNNKNAQNSSTSVTSISQELPVNGNIHIIEEGAQNEPAR